MEAALESHGSWKMGMTLALAVNGAETDEEMEVGERRMFEVLEHILQDGAEDPLELILSLIDRIITVEEHERGASMTVLPVLAIAAGMERAARREGLPSHLPGFQP